MKKLLLILALLWGLPTLAQSTTVSGNVTDLGGQAWFGGWVEASFVPTVGTQSNQFVWSGGAFNPQITIRAFCNVSGNYTMSVPSNTAMNIANSQWTFTANSGTTSLATQRFTVTVT